MYYSPREVFDEVMETLKEHPRREECESVVNAFWEEDCFQVIHKTWRTLDSRNLSGISVFLQMIEPENTESPNFLKVALPTLRGEYGQPYVDLTLPQGNPISYQNSALKQTLEIINSGLHSVCFAGTNGCGKTATIFQL